MPATERRLRRSVRGLADAAAARMDETLPWFATLSPAQRGAVTAVAEAGIAGFVDFVTDPGGDATGVFSAAPADLARTISLQQTVELVEATVHVVEEQVPALAGPREQAGLHEAVLRYSRTIAFAAARVYAAAAESRGAWDARLEALIVDALLRDAVDDAVLSRAAALGWNAAAPATAVVGATPKRSLEQVSAAMVRSAAAGGRQAMVGVQGERLVLLLGGTEPGAAVDQLLPQFGAGPVVVGPIAADLAGAAYSVAEAVAGWEAVRGWPDAPRPVAAGDLLPERVLRGDHRAVARLHEQVHAPLAAHPDLLATAAAYLESVSSLEGVARMLFVHPNTVRYRMRRIADLTGCALTDPRGALTLRLALIQGRLQDL